MSKKLAIVTTHPIQYNAPLFKLLARRQRIIIKVFYTFSQSKKGTQYDAGFGKHISWDIPLLEDYDYEFVHNTAKEPGTHHFSGINNPGLVSRINAWEPDALLVYGWSFKSHLQCLRKFHNKIPVLFRGDSNLLDGKTGFAKFARTIILRWVYGNVDHALYVGTANKAYYLQYGLSENQLTFAPHAIDNERFGMQDLTLQQKVQQYRIKLGIGETDIVFLFAGKLEPKKDPETLITAFRKVGENARLVIVGNGILEDELKQKYKATNIHFLNFQNQTEMPGIYRLGDVFVLPSSGPGETWGLAVNEAMASGCPVIVSDKCGCAVDLVKYGENGFVFKSRDVEDLAVKMKSMLDRAVVKRMGEHSKQVIKQWTMQNVCKKIEDVVLKS